MYEPVVPIDYATKDYEGFLQMMKSLIPDLLPEWTDLSESDFGMVILQLAAYGLHVLSFYQDKAFNENFLSTARNRDSIVKLCRFLGYELGIQKPSIATVTFTKYEDSLNIPVKIPAGTKVSTDPQLGDIVVFETEEEVTIPAGVLSTPIVVIQGETYKDDIIGIGDDSKSQKIVVETEDILLDTLSIYTTELGIKREWDKVDDFLSSTSKDLHYTAVIDSNANTEIVFGDGISGSRVSSNTPIYCTYRVGGGSRGNVGAGKITYLYNDINEIESINNIEKASGGEDFESVEKARILAPKLYKTYDRAVTTEDFSSLAMKVQGVAKAKTIETFNENNDVFVYIVPDDYEEAPISLLDRVKTELENKMLVNNILTVFPTEYVPYDLEVTVEIKDEYNNFEKQEEILSYLQKVLSPNHYNHGESIPISYIVGKIHGISGVRKVEVNASVLGATPTEELSCSTIQFLKLDSLTIDVVGGI